MVLNNSGLQGLKVVTNAIMFFSAESFDFGSSKMSTYFSYPLSFRGRN